MKIAHVIDYFQPELGYQETYLAEEQIKDGHEVRVFTSDRYFPFPNFETTYQDTLGKRIKGTGNFVEKGIEVTRLPIKREKFSRAWLIGLEQELVDYEPEYLLVHSLMSITAHKVSKIKFKKKPFLVFDDHMSGLEKENFRRKIMRFYYNLFLKEKIVKVADSIVTITETGSEYLNSVFSISKEKLACIPLGFDPKIFYKSKGLRVSTRKSLKLSSEDFLIAYTGKINLGKGFNELINALKKLHNKHKNIKFLCIGNGDQNIEIRLEKELGKFLIKLDFVTPEKLCSYYNAADLAIWPNGITASHIEANACALPIIVSNWSASVERVQKGNGTYVKECKEEYIYEAIEALIENRDILEKMSLNAEIASKELTWKALNQKFLDLVD